MSARSCFALAASACALLLGALVPAAVAAPPTNDDFADAPDIGPLPSFVEGDNTEATAEPGEPGDFGGPFHSVWFKWTAEDSGPVRVDVCDTEVEAPRFKVFTGETLASLQQVAGNSFWASADCAQIFEMTAGTTYHVVVDTPTATGAFDLFVGPAQPPSNDDFANARTVGPSLPILFFGGNHDASAEPGEPQHTYTAAPTKSVWYRWVAPYTGEATFDSNCGTGLVVEAIPISIYTGSSLGNLVEVVSTVCFVTVNVTAGTSYWIAPNAFEEGLFAFRISSSGFGGGGDDFAAGQVIPSGLPQRATGSNVGASWEDGEPDHFTGLEAETSIWYRWTANTTGLVSVDTCNSDFDSVLSVYTGAAVTALTRLAEGDDDPSCDTETTNPFGSAAKFSAVAGTEYRIAVDGYDVGALDLRLGAAGPQTAPPPPATKPSKKKRCGKKGKAKSSKGKPRKKKCGKKPKRRR